jgi:hypothetical protein
LQAGPPLAIYTRKAQALDAGADRPACSAADET